MWVPKGDMLDRVYDAIRDFNRRTLNRETSITRRRIRAWFHREAAGVRFHEMVELAEVAKAARTQRQTIEEARKGHAEFISNAARLASALAVQDEEFHRDAIELLGRLAGTSSHQAIGNDQGQGDVDPHLGYRSGQTLGAGGDQ